MNSKWLLIAPSVLFLFSGCLPKDAYRMKYPQQDIDYSLTTPLSSKESDKESRQNLKNPNATAEYQSSDTSLDTPKFKKVKDTMKFYGNEDEKPFYKEKKENKKKKEKLDE
jgi:hypothetical protein